MIAVLIADDHPIVRRGIREILESTSDIKVIAETATAADTLAESARAKRCDLIVLDLSMPGRSGLDLLREVRQSRPDIPVLVLSMHSERQFAIESFRAGASGYLTKESAPSELVSAVRKVTGGGQYVTGWVAERLALALRPGHRSISRQTLSPREAAVLRLIGQGKSSREIANLLKVSIKTVATHRSRILVKLQLDSTAALVRYAIRRGLE